jgi:hypothetical protein
LIGLLFFGLCSLVQADEIYTYTGNPFTTFSGTGCETECSVSGYFDVAVPLADNLFDIEIYPTTFDFDGITQATAEYFLVTTDATGEIVSWQIDIQNGPVALDTFTRGGV